MCFVKIVRVTTLAAEPKLPQWVFFNSHLKDLDESYYISEWTLVQPHCADCCQWQRITLEGYGLGLEVRIRVHGLELWVRVHGLGWGFRVSVRLGSGTKTMKIIHTDFPAMKWMKWGYFEHFKDGLRQDEIFLMGSIWFSSEKISLTQFPLLMHLICYNVSPRSKNRQSAWVLQGRDSKPNVADGGNDQGDRRDAVEIWMIPPFLPS